MNSIWCLLLWTCAILSSNLAVADSDDLIAADFRAKASRVPLELKSLGYSQFGGIVLDELLETIKRTRIIVSHEWAARPESAALNSPTRSSATWQRDQHGAVIFVYAKSWKRKPPATAEILAMHECKGVLGFNDHNYGPSTTLWLLARPESRDLFTQNEKLQIEQRMIQMAGGGIIGVGGGGDDFGISKKLRTIDHDLARLKESSGSDRQRVFGELLIHLDEVEERRESPPLSSRVHPLREVSPEIVRDSFMKCRDLINRPPEQQDFVFTTLSQLAPRETRQHNVQNRDQMVEYCRKFVARGLAAWLRDAEIILRQRKRRQH